MGGDDSTMEFTVDFPATAKCLFRAVIKIS